MIVKDSLSVSLQYWPVAVVLIVSAFLLHQRFQKGLSRYPGPFLASMTDLWHVYDAVRDYQRSAWLRWHDTYGDVVRIAPNKLSFADPKVIPDILGPGKDFRKSGYYFVSAATAHGRAVPSMFSTLDKPYHDRIKRAVNSAFSVTSLVRYEPYVDDVISTWLDQIGCRFADTGEPCNLATWMHFYSLDVIGKVVYGQQYGFLTSGADIDGMVESTQKMLNYANWAGLAPWLDFILAKNPLKMWLARRGWLKSQVNPAVTAALKQQNARGLDLETNSTPDAEKLQSAQHDLLEQFIKAKQDRPELLSNHEILMLGISMVFAGSDSTAWTLSAFFYYVLRTPGVYAKLVGELEANAEGGIMQFNKAQKLPYLDACVKETFRMHPAGRFPSERVVPAGGAMIGNEYIAGGTVVALNAWVLHRRKEVWGEDVETFRPERWLENLERSNRMAGALFHFGAGNFICLGRNISLLEMYKITSTALTTFDFELVDKEREWTLLPGSFVRMDSVNVRISRRARRDSGE